MESPISFVLDGRIVSPDLAASPLVTPTTTLLRYLRDLPNHKGAKEGCAEGDCGACTVVLADVGPDRRLRYRAVDSCLLFLPMIHGMQVITVEELRAPDGTLHPVQQAMVDFHGSQCGFCTPGIVMSLFALYKRGDVPSRSDVEEALSGNLCRCTGYRPIVDAALKACATGGEDHFSALEPQMIELLSSVAKTTLFLQTDGQLYLRPASFLEAKSFRVQYSDAVLINGATDAALRVTKNHERFPRVIDLSAVAELHTVQDRPDSLTLGAGATIEEIIPLIRIDFPALAEMLRWFGSRQIRSLGTIGGSLGTASPIGDILPVLIAYDARIELESLRGQREIPAGEYAVGYRKTVRTPDELIKSVILPKNTCGALIQSYKVSRRKELDIATVSAGFRLERSTDGTVSRLLLAYGGMAERTMRAQKVERSVTGRLWSRDVVEEAAQHIADDFHPISDARATADGRLVMAKNLLMKFWTDTRVGGDHQ